MSRITTAISINVKPCPAPENDFASILDRRIRDLRFGKKRCMNSGLQTQGGSSDYSISQLLI
ncbi:MAG: hypothetical protein PVG46_06625, partial [Desulfobacterales bacterium]